MLNRCYSKSHIAAIGLALSCFSYFFGGCSAPVVKSEKDNRVDLSQYKTYKWLSQEGASALRLESPKIDYIAGTSKITQKPQIETEVKATVDRQLHNKGFHKSNSASPDFIVTFYAKAKDEDWASTWSGTTPSINNIPVVMYPDFDRSKARDYREGDLLMVFYDPKTKKPAWTGIIVSAVHGKKVDRDEINASIADLFSEFVTNVKEST